MTAQPLPCGCTGTHQCAELKALVAQAEDAWAKLQAGPMTPEARAAFRALSVEAVGHLRGLRHPPKDGILTGVMLPTGSEVSGLVSVFIDGQPHIGKLDAVREAWPPGLWIGDRARVSLDGTGDVVAVAKVTEH